jgi:hypothetical protein
LHVADRLKNGWATIRPIFFPCSPYDVRCMGTRTKIESLRIVGAS